MMKKLLTLCAALACTIGATATGYKGGLSVVLNGTPSSYQQANIEVIRQDDGKYELKLADFVMPNGDGKLYVGTIDMQNVEAVESNDETILSAAQQITIAPGSDPDQMWLGPALSVTPIPVKLKASLKGNALRASIHIPFATMGLDIDVLFNSTVLQIPNSGFEDFHIEKSGSKSGYEPNHWHSFLSATGMYASTQNAFSDIHTSVSKDVRPGTVGKSSILVKATSIFGIVANGTITSREDYVPHFTKKNVEAMLNDDPTDGWDNVNYIDKVFGTGHLMKHNLSVQGGTKALSYYVGGGYMNQKGNIDNFDYRRYNLRSNLNADLGRGWKMDLGLVGTITRKNQPRYNSGGSDGVDAGGETGWLSIGHQTVMMRPYLPEKWNGLYTGAIPNNNSIVYSPLAAIYESGYKKTRATEINSNFSISYDAPWLKGLSFKATGAYDYLSSRNKNLSTAYQTYAPNSAGQLIIYNDPEAVQQNQLAEGQYTTEQMVGQFSVAYARMFGKHNIDAMMLVEGRDFKSSSMAAYAEKIPFAGLPELSYGTPLAKDSQSGYSGHTRTAGYVFRLKYDYNNTYLAEFSGRYDGSYNFSGNVSSKRWGFFPSFSAAWRVSNEKFMESTKSWLSDFKLRASMGLLGNDAVSAYSFLSTYSFAGNRVFNGNIYSSLYTSSVANPELTWSKTRTSNLGFDLTLWDGKLGLEFDWFYNLNYDILASMAGDKAPSMGGYFHSVANHDRYANYGLEWTVSHRNKFQLAGKPFQYGASLNMTYAKSKWLRYLDQPNMQEWRKRVGTSVDACDVWIADGLFRSEEEIDNSAWYGSRPNVGDIKYRDINGDGKIDEQDRARIGRSNRPEIMMGLNLNASWNGFDLNMQFTGGFKFDVSMLGTYYNYCDDNTIWTQTFKEGANSPLWLVQDAYSIDNPNGKYPRITLSNVTHGGDNGLASTFWMRNGNYIRLKTAQLGYTLPKQWLRTINIERVRLFVEGSNLFTIDSLPTGIDPESPGVNNGYYPQQRTFLGGINITF